MRQIIRSSIKISFATYLVFLMMNVHHIYGTDSFFMDKEESSENSFTAAGVDGWSVEPDIFSDAIIDPAIPLEEKQSEEVVLVPMNDDTGAIQSEEEGINNNSTALELSDEESQDNPADLQSDEDSAPDGSVDEQSGEGKPNDSDNDQMDSTDLDAETKNAEMSKSPSNPDADDSDKSQEISDDDDV